MYVGILVGLIAGWLTGKLTRGRGYGVLMDILLGLVGGVIGFWIFDLLHIHVYGAIGHIAMATTGAVALVSATHLMRGEV